MRGWNVSTTCGVYVYAGSLTRLLHYDEGSIKGVRTGHRTRYSMPDFYAGISVLSLIGIVTTRSWKPSKCAGASVERKGESAPLLLYCAIERCT